MPVQVLAAGCKSDNPLQVSPPLPLQHNNMLPPLPLLAGPCTCWATWPASPRSTSWTRTSRCALDSDRMVFGGPAVTPPCRSCPSPCWLSLVKCKPLLAVPCQVQTPCVALLSCHAPAPRSKQVVPYTLLLSVVEYKTLVLRGDMETAADVLETIPQASCSWLQGADVYRLSSCVSCQPLTYLVQESRNHVCRQPLAQLPVHTGPAIMCAASHWLSCWCTRALRSCVPPATGSAAGAHGPCDHVCRQPVALSCSCTRALRSCVPPAHGAQLAVCCWQCCRTSTTALPNSWRRRACRSRRCRWPQTQVRRSCQIWSGCHAERGVLHGRPCRWLLSRLRSTRLRRGCVSSRRLQGGMLLEGGLRASRFCPSLTAPVPHSHQSQTTSLSWRWAWAC